MARVFAQLKAVDNFLGSTGLRLAIASEVRAALKRMQISQAGRFPPRGSVSI